VKPVTYALSNLTLRALIADLGGPIEVATLVLVRIDERLACSDTVLADGVQARANLFEAQALAHLSGELVSLEDLVLHDAGMDIRAPSTGVVRAMRALNQRRSLAWRVPDAVLEPGALAQLLGIADDGVAGDANGLNGKAAALTRHDAGLGEVATGPGQYQAPDRPISGKWLKPWDMPRPFSHDEDALWLEDEQDRSESFEATEPLTSGRDATRSADDSALGDFAEIDALLSRTQARLDALVPPAPGVGSFRLRDPGHDATALLDAWRAALETADAAPAVLSAAIALDAWLTLEPAERGGEVGYALSATVLRQRGLAAHHLPTLGLGLRKGRFRWSPHQAQAARLAGLIEAIHDSARLAGADLKRLALAREIMMRRCEGRRGNSRLGELVDLFMASPLVTVQMATDKLKVTPQAVEAMLRELGPSLPRELTGRKRYRAWGIV
jgi:hypothetical protein